VIPPLTGRLLRTKFSLMRRRRWLWMWAKTFWPWRLQRKPKVLTKIVRCGAWRSFRSGVWSPDQRALRAYYYAREFGFDPEEWTAANDVPEPPDPVHAEDGALAVNARHGCTCGAEPTR